jgi:hypothetical protein
VSNQVITSDLDNISVSVQAATSISISTVTLTNAGTEYSYNFASNLKGFEIKSRNRAELKCAFNSGDIASLIYVTIPKDTQWESAVDLNLSSETIYFVSDTNSTLVEIVEYT